MPVRALRPRRWRSDFAFPARLLKTMNAREGIKTPTNAGRTCSKCPLKTMNAREGIKTDARAACIRSSMCVKNNECP